MITCSETDCGKPRKALGRCLSHYHKHKRAKADRSRIGSTAANRFNRMFERGGDEECWEWTRSRTPQGYGKFQVSSYRSMLASRFALVLSSGSDLDSDLQACHTCDNPPCVNPAHLYWGTARDNLQDQIDRGRKPAHTSSRLTEQTVVQLRERYAAGESASDLGREFGVKQSTVFGVVNGKVWKDAQGPITFRYTRRRRDG